MQQEWYGVIGALGGASLTGIVVIVRDVILAKRGDRTAEAQRAHEISERRFDSRRDAYFAFASECYATITRTYEYEMENFGGTPGDHGHEGPHRKVIDALDLVRIIGPKEAEVAALAASTALHEWAFAKGNADRAEASVAEFNAVIRRVLKFDQS